MSEPSHGTAKRKRNVKPFQERIIQVTRRPDLGPCHEFDGAKNRWGYGNVTRDGKCHSAHRLAWIEAKGPIPTGMCVMHKCDNPICINVAHLTIGTAKDNMADAAKKGRMKARRSKKISDDQIKIMIETPGTISEKAKKAGCNIRFVQRTMQRITSKRI